MEQLPDLHHLPFYKVRSCSDSGGSALRDLEVGVTDVHAKLSSELKCHNCSHHFRQWGHLTNLIFVFALEHLGVMRVYDHEGFARAVWLIRGRGDILIITILASPILILHRWTRFGSQSTKSLLLLGTHLLLRNELHRAALRVLSSSLWWGSMLLSYLNLLCWTSTIN